jgi:hypothetical protein
MKKQVITVDIVAMIGIFALLMVGILFDLEKYLFSLPFVTLYAFYLIGKFARDYELKLWERKHSGSDHAPQ